MWNAVLKSIHIGILDFTLDELSPEYYAEYQFINKKNHEVFGDKMQLNVLSLKHMNLATGDDIKYGVHMKA